MPAAASPGRVYSATYSHVPVYEFLINGEQIMRRRKDDYVNATHILKAANFDKPARTRILEREVQKGIHEKVQGGYGKYQGTWIPLAEARALADKNGVLEKLRPILDFVPGDRSPPPAPKHATASSKPKVPRQPTARRAPAAVSRAQPSELSYDNYSTRDTPVHTSVRSESPDEFIPNPRFSNHNRKRKRGMEEPATMSYEDQHYLLWADELLDFFMLQDSAEPLAGPPDPPPSADMNRSMDEKGHTPMHWASAMGDMNVVQDLLNRGARIDSQSFNGETPLMRAVMFTNNFDKQTMDRLAHTLISTVGTKDLCLATVFHHIAATTCSKTKYACARYYFVTILERMKSSFSPQYVAEILNSPDQNGDTAILIAARFGARKCVRTLLTHGASIDIQNHHGETASNVIEQLNARRRDREGLSFNVTSSSPVRELENGFGSQGTTIDGNHISALQHTPLSKRQRVVFRSEAANILSSQLPVLISNRAEALAAALENELAAREAEVSEGARVLEARREEIERMKAEYQRLAAEAEENAAANGTGYSDSEAEGQLKMLEEEVRELLELDQHQELERLIQAEQHKKQHSDMPNGSSTPSPQTKQALARQLVDAQTKRKELVDGLVELTGMTRDASSLFVDASTPVHNHDSTAETRAKHHLYKRLIRSALDIRHDSDADIEEMLPEILKQLEEDKRDRDGADSGLADVTLMDVDGRGVSLRRGVAVV